jgi:capsular exopolysaccharide synthesis family protein
MALEENGIFGDEHSSITLKERLSSYLAYWPLFVILVFLGVGIGLIYSKNTVPKYIASTSFLVKGAESTNDLIQSAVKVSEGRNINDEILKMKSMALMQRTVAKHNLNIDYYQKGSLLNIDIYEEAPFRLIPQRITDSNRAYSLFIEKMTAAGGEFLYGPKDDQKTYSFQWNKPFTVDKQSFTLAPVGSVQSSDNKYIVSWLPVAWVAADLADDLVVKSSEKSNAVTISIKTRNLEKGKQAVDALFTEFNLSDIEDRNKLAENTVRFIDERLYNISRELDSVEGNLEAMQGKNQVFDMPAQTGAALGNSDEAAKTIKDLAVQRGVTTMISNYFENPDNNGRLVPSSLGLEDGTLAALINQYNQLQLLKDREAPNVAPNSTVMQDLNAQMNSVKGSIMENLGNIKKNLQLRENSFQQQRSQFRGVLAAAPHNERVLLQMKRNQDITSGLYMYLLQEKEENAISSTGASVPAYQQLDRATGYGPVEPNTMNIILAGGLLGFFLAFGWVYMKDQLLNDKISTKIDVIKRTSVPVLGQISHAPRKNREVISVLGRNLAGEEFRALRTKLSFLLKNKKEKVIMLTSTSSNEGKSFISLNLAAVCGIPGKKVALLEFDIRKPSIANMLGLEHSAGLTDYLSGDINTISKIRYNIDEIPSLHIYPSGAISLNAADLLLSNNVNKLFDELKEEYDFIIVDTPPVGMVSDAFLLNPFCDMVLYIVRHKVTLKNQMENISDIKHNNNLDNMYVILNDAKSGNKNTAYYGYNKDYNYGKPAKSKSTKQVLASFFSF